MSVHEIRATGATPPAGPYSHAIHAGDFLFVSGEGPLDEQGRVIGDGIAEQTAATMDNLARILSAAGASFRNVVKATVFLSDMQHYVGFNQAYRPYVSAPFPARICIAAGGLYDDILVEIDLIAYLES